MHALVRISTHTHAHKSETHSTPHTPHTNADPMYAIYTCTPERVQRSMRNYNVAPGMCSLKKWGKRDGYAACLSQQFSGQTHHDQGGLV